MDKEIENRNRAKKRVLAVCCLVAVAGIGLHNAYSVFIPSILSDLSIGQSVYGLLSIGTSIMSSLCSFLVVRIAVRRGAKVVIAAGSLLTLLGYLVMAASRNVVVFFIAKLIDGLGYGLLGNTMLFLIINQWFPEGSGTASSIMMCFSGIAGTVFSPLFARCIERIGFRASFMVVGFGCVILCLPFLLIKERLYSSYIDEEPQRESAPVEKVESYPELNKKFAAFFCVCMVGGFSFLNTITGTYLTSFGLEKGLDLTQASLLISAGMIGNTVSKLINGVMSDHIGVLPTNIIMFAISLVSTACLLLTDQLVLLLLLSFLYGFVYSVSGLGYSLTDKEIYGPEQYRKAQPIVVFISTVTYSIGLPIIGGLYDLTGSYALPFLCSSGFSLLAIGCLIYLMGFKKRWSKD